MHALHKLRQKEEGWLEFGFMSWAIAPYTYKEAAEINKLWIVA